MSRSTPVCHPYCSKCKAEHSHLNSRKYVRPWLNTEVIGVDVDRGFVSMRCRNCGYVWNSRSAWARRGPISRERIKRSAESKQHTNKSAQSARKDDLTT